MAAPGTGPLARATDRHTPAPDSDAARSRARSALAARNTQVGPEPDTSAPSAPSSSPAASVLRSAGNSDSAAGCRSEEHTSELQSQSNLVCRLLLEKKTH